MRSRPAQQVEGRRHVATVEIPLFLGQLVEQPHRLVAEEQLEVARLAEIDLRGKEGRALDLGRLALGFEIGQGRRQRRPGHAIADDVDRIDIQRVAHRIDRVDLALEHIIVERDVGDALVGRFPADHEQRNALVDAPADEAFLRGQVEDVEAVDPRREDDQRGCHHLVGDRRIMDQLEERRFMDHLARRRGEVAADLERRPAWSATIARARCRRACCGAR